MASLTSASSPNTKLSARKVSVSKSELAPCWAHGGGGGEGEGRVRGCGRGHSPGRRPLVGPGTLYLVSSSRLQQGEMVKS